MPQDPRPAGQSFAVSFPANRSAAPIDGRVIRLLSKDQIREPRTHVAANESLATPYIFGLNVDELASGNAAVLEDKAFGWPARPRSALPVGDYEVRAVLNRYEAFHMADGRTLTRPPDQGEGQQWASQPGNLYSAPTMFHVMAGRHSEKRCLNRGIAGSLVSQRRHSLQECQPTGFVFDPFRVSSTGHLFG